MHCFLNLLIILLTVILNSLLCNLYTPISLEFVSKNLFCFFDQALFLFLCMPCNIVLHVSMHLKEVTSLSLYGLTSFRERPPPICLASQVFYTYEGFSNLLYICLFSRLVHVISLLQTLVSFFLWSLQSLSLSGVCLWYCRFSGTVVSY